MQMHRKSQKCTARYLRSQFNLWGDEHENLREIDFTTVISKYLTFGSYFLSGHILFHRLSLFTKIPEVFAGQRRILRTRGMWEGMLRAVHS